MGIVEIESKSHWHSLREKRIGASEIAALFGVKAFHTKHELWSRMRGLYTTQIESDFLEFGNDMEPIVAKYLARTYGMKIMKSSQYHWPDKYPWLGASLDYYILHSEHGPALLQIKHASGPWVQGWSQTKAPDYIELQVQQELFVTNSARIEMGQTPFERIYIGAMMGGNVDDLRFFERQAIPSVVEEIIERSTDFMETVAAGEPPIDSEKDIAHLRDMFMDTEIFREHIDLADQSDRLEQEIRIFHEMQDAEGKASKRKDLARARLMRACLVIDKEDVIAHKTGTTENYEINMVKSETHYRAKEAYVDDQLRFSIKKRRSP